jgi:hypothetical protein
MNDTAELAEIMMTNYDDQSIVRGDIASVRVSIQPDTI